MSECVRVCVKETSCFQYLKKKKRKDFFTVRTRFCSFAGLRENNGCELVFKDISFTNDLPLCCTSQVTTARRRRSSQVCSHPLELNHTDLCSSLAIRFLTETTEASLSTRQMKSGLFSSKCHQSRVRTRSISPS